MPKWHRCYTTETQTATRKQYSKRKPPHVQLLLGVEGQPYADTLCKQCASHALACISTAHTRPEPNKPSNVLTKLYAYVDMPPSHSNHHPVMSRACGHVPEHTPLRVTFRACHCKQPMAYKAHTHPCAAHPHAQSQDEHRI